MVLTAAHGFIGHQVPALSQQILDVAEAQSEPDIKPDRLLDDFGREAVAAIADLGDVTMPLRGVWSKVAQLTTYHYALASNKRGIANAISSSTFDL
jgi:hypothetical protein